MLYDDAIAAFARATGAPVQGIFFAGYVAGLALLFGAIVSIGRALYQTWLGVAMLAVLMTLRHRITQTGANSLESYFQPRMIAFALGAWAIAAYLRGRAAVALVLVALAFAIHPTTAMWFAIWIGVALFVSERAWRLPLAALAAVGGSPLSGRSRSAHCVAIWRVWIRSGLPQWRARITSFRLNGTRRSGSST